MNAAASIDPVNTGAVRRGIPRTLMNANRFAFVEMYIFRKFLASIFIAFTGVKLLLALVDTRGEQFQDNGVALIILFCTFVLGNDQGKKVQVFFASLAGTRGEYLLGTYGCIAGMWLVYVALEFLMNMLLAAAQVIPAAEARFTLTGLNVLFVIVLIGCLVPASVRAEKQDLYLGLGAFFAMLLCTSLLSYYPPFGAMRYHLVRVTRALTIATVTRQLPTAFALAAGLLTLLAASFLVSYRLLRRKDLS